MADVTVTCPYCERKGVLRQDAEVSVSQGPSGRCRCGKQFVLRVLPVTRDHVSLEAYIKHLRGKIPKPSVEQSYGGNPVDDTGVDTAVKAAETAFPRAGSKRREVLEFVAGRGDRGATDHEIESALDMVHQPRRKELEQRGLVFDSGRRRKTPRKSEAIVWVATDFAKQMLSNKES